MTDTTYETAPDTANGFDAAADRVRALNEKLIETAKNTGNASLDAYEQALSGFVAVQRRVAGATRLGWLNTAVEAQTTFVTEVGAAYTTAAREALK
jgi:hypothetical protein